MSLRCRRTSGRRWPSSSQAAKVFDALFLRQVWDGNESMLLDLARDGSPLGRARQHYFLINKGPWSRLDDNEPFIPGAPPKPPQANFYPAGATKAEVEAWFKTLPEAERTRATGFLHHDPPRPRRQVHRRAVHPRVSGRDRARRDAAARGGGADRRSRRSRAISRSAPRRSSATTTTTATSRGWSSTPASSRPSVRTRSTRTSGSTTRPRSRRSSRCATMPRRRSWRDSVASCRRSRTTCRSIRSIRNPKLGALAPIRVVNTVFSSGDANRGVQTAAFNLPNDERVIAEKGSKRVMLKNNQEAKFRMVLQPISKVALAADDQQHVAFDAFFTHILMHELMHGLGPAQHHRRRTRDDRAAGVQGHLQHDRGSQGGHLRALRAAVPGRSREARQVVQRHDVHHLPRVDVPLDPLRHQRGARPRRGDSAQLLPRQRRRHRRAGRHVCRQSRAHQAERHRPHARHHDDAGDGRLRRRRSR